MVKGASITITYKGDSIFSVEKNGVADVETAGMFVSLFIAWLSKSLAAAVNESPKPIHNKRYVARKPRPKSAKRLLHIA